MTCTSILRGAKVCQFLKRWLATNPIEKLRNTLWPSKVYASKLANAISVCRRSLFFFFPCNSIYRLGIRYKSGEAIDLFLRCFESVVILYGKRKLHVMTINCQEMWFKLHFYTLAFSSNLFWHFVAQNQYPTFVLDFLFLQFCSFFRSMRARAKWKILMTSSAEKEFWAFLQIGRKFQCQSSAYFSHLCLGTSLIKTL